MIQNSKHFNLKHPTTSSDSTNAAALEPRQAANLHNNQSAGQQVNGNARFLKDEHGCAFDNPYFKDDHYLARQVAEQQAEASARTAHSQFKLSSKPELANLNELSSIDNHISTLHSRQVTSSFKELTILGECLPYH